MNIHTPTKEEYSKITAEDLEREWGHHIPVYFAEVLNGTTSLDEARDNILSFNEEYYNKWLAECDGGCAGCDGGAAGGDAGGIASAGGDATGVGSVDVTGDCNHQNNGYLGPGCFHIPFGWSTSSREILGSKKKKKKKTKNPYVVGMKVLSEEDEEALIDFIQTEVEKELKGNSDV